MSVDFCLVFFGDEAVNVGNFHSFSKFPHRGQNLVIQTDATARHINNNREIICDFSLIYLCSVPIFL